MAHEGGGVKLKHLHLCIGGPLDGQRYITDPGAETFRVATKVDVPPTKDGKPRRRARSPAHDVSPVPHVVYVLQKWAAGPQDGRIVWVPEGQTAAHTLDLLCAGYRKGRPTS